MQKLGPEFIYCGQIHWAQILPQFYWAQIMAP